MTVRVWVEVQTLAETSELAERMALEIVHGMEWPPPAEHLQAAVFGMGHFVREEEST